MARKVVFVNRYFYPDTSATAQMLADLCFSLVEAGYSVSVVTGNQGYDDSSLRMKTRESIRGVSIFRCPGTHFGRERLAGRMFDYLSFYLTALWRVLLILRPGDVLVAKTDPPLLAIVLFPVAKIRRATLINWLQDLFPEIAGHLESVPVRDWLVTQLKRLRNASCRAAAQNIVISQQMRDYLAGHNVDSHRLTLIPNWAPPGISPITHNRNALRSEWHLDDSFVIGYSGNLGRAHDWLSVLGLIEGFDDCPDILFLFIGDGDGMRKLRREVQRLGLSRVYFKPYQPRHRLSESLSAIDLHLVSLQRGLGPFLVPSKIYGIAAAGRPVIFIGPEESEVSAILRRHDFGLTVANSEPERLVAAARKLLDDPEMYQRSCQNARIAHDTHFAFKRSMGAWRRVLLQCGIDKS